MNSLLPQSSPPEAAGRCLSACHYDVLEEGAAMTHSKYWDRPINWEVNGLVDGPYDMDVPLKAIVDGVLLEIKVGDYLDGPLYTLLIDGEPADEFDGFPDGWIRPLGPAGRPFPF
jgi:hypothetical protein